MFDNFLRLLESSIGNNFATYADDLVVEDSRRELEVKGQDVVNMISNWCKHAKLELSVRKTEGIILKSGMIVMAVIGRQGGARPNRQRKVIRSSKADMAANHSNRATID